MLSAPAKNCCLHTKAVTTMSNPVTQSNIANRLRDDLQRPPGYRNSGRRLKHGGRKQGTPNKTTLELMDAVLKAAEGVGSNLNGKDGLVGYLMRVGRKDTKAFGSLLRAVLPLRASVTIDESMLTLEDHKAEFEKRGSEMPFWFSAYLNGDLERLAAHYEKELSLEIKLLPK